MSDQELSAAELKFVELYVTRHVHGLPRYKIAQEAFNPSYTNASAATVAWQTLRDPRIVQAVSERLSEVQRSSIASLDELREYFTSIVRGYGAHFELLADWRLEPSESGEHYEYVAIVADPEDIPAEIRQHVEKLTPHVDGGWLIQLRQDDMTKERIKAAELLAKLQGGFTERVELSGGVVVADAGITPDMSATEASARYRELLLATRNVPS